VVVCRVGIRGDNELDSFCGELFRNLAERVAGGLGAATAKSFSASSDSTSSSSVSSWRKTKFLHDSLILHNLSCATDTGRGELFFELKFHDMKAYREGR
jgi:hypothetical protein